MTTRLTASQQRLLNAVAAGHGKAGIYGLAGVLGRPYRRVYDQVRMLEAAGRLRTVRGRAGGRRVVRVLPRRSAPRAGAASASTPAGPPLRFNRAWSALGKRFDADATIAQVLARPTFRDLLACVLEFGLDRVRDRLAAMVSAFELSPQLVVEDARMLANIESGLHRAAAG